MYSLGSFSIFLVSRKASEAGIFFFYVDRMVSYLHFLLSSMSIRLDVKNEQ